MELLVGKSNKNRDKIDLQAAARDYAELLGVPYSQLIDQYTVTTNGARVLRVNVKSEKANEIKYLKSTTLLMLVLHEKEKHPSLTSADIVKTVWPQIENSNHEPEDQKRILKEAAALCGEEKSLQDALLEILKQKKENKKGRGRSKVFKITHDRTKQRQMVRARFDGEPWFKVGDSMKVELVMLDNQPAIVMKKVNSKT